MSSQVKDAKEAMDIAHKTAQKAGLVFWFVSSVEKKNGYWIAQVTALAGVYTVKIDSSTGEVIEFKPVSR